MKYSNDASATVDQVSMNILSRCEPILLEEFNPISIYGDGNCLFRAISQGLYGSEKYHLLIRLLTSIEIIQNPDFYNEDKEKCKNLVKGSDYIALPSYKEVVKSTCTPGAYMSLLQIYAASAALSVPIYSQSP